MVISNGFWIKNWSYLQGDLSYVYHTNRLHYINRTLHDLPDNNPVHLLDQLPTEKTGDSLEELEIHLQVQALFGPVGTGDTLQVTVNCHILLL